MSGTFANKNSLSEVHHFKIPKRTEGDGMEKEEVDTNNTPVAEKMTLRDQLIYRPVNLKECSLPATPVVGKTFSLTPKTTIDSRKKSSPNIKIAREPKFVPYEPYKAATNPIFQNKHNRLPKLVNNSGADIEKLLPHIRQLSVNDLNSHNLGQSSEIDGESKENTKWREEKQSMLEEVSRLKKENAELENQVKYQAQVNAEIKKLLVAAVGEDIETRVQLLAEDKLHLAKQLIKTANTLSTHQEQIEWLAGQSEVWRSKFLSSSMLVEDLARWKAGLCQKLMQYEKVLKSLLEDNDKTRQYSFQTFINLTTLQEKFNLDVMPPDSEELHLISLKLVDLCSSNYNLSEMLLNQLLRENIIKKKFQLDSLGCLSSAEKEAEQALSLPMITFRHTDVACSAVMTGAALALSSASPHCSHCNGTVKTV